MISEAFSSARNSILLLSPCKMAKTYLGLLPIGTARFTIENETKKKLGEKQGFHVQKLLQLEDFLHIFQQIFWSNHPCPVVS